MKKFQLLPLEVELVVVQRVSLLDLDNVLLFHFLQSHGLGRSLLRLPSIAGKPSLFFLPYLLDFFLSLFLVSLTFPLTS